MDNHFGETYRQLWTTLVEHLDRERLAALDVYRAERQALDEGTALGLFRHPGEDNEEALQRRAAVLIEDMVNRARVQFAPPGHDRIDIDREAYLARFAKRPASGTWAEFDPAAVWADILAHYDGVLGHEVGYKEAAKAIVRFFCLARGKALERKAGCVVLNQRIIEDGYTAGQISTTSRMEMTDFQRHWCTFALWAGEEADGKGLCRFIDQVNYSYRVESRARIAISAHLTVITYRSRFEYRFTPALAESLQTFVSAYGAEHLREVA